MAMKLRSSILFRAAHHLKLAGLKDQGALVIKVAQELAREEKCLEEQISRKGNQGDVNVRQKCLSQF